MKLGAEEAEADMKSEVRKKQKKLGGNHDRRSRPPREEDKEDPR